MGDEEREAEEMEKKVIVSSVLRSYATALLLLALCLCVPKAYFGPGQPWYGPFLYHFTHANIFHLLGNWLVIARFKPRWVTLPVAYLSATAAAICPFSAMSAPTCGISGMVFAMLARRDALLGIKPWRIMGLNVLLAFVPTYNWRIHLLAYLFSFGFWLIIKKRYYS